MGCVVSAPRVKVSDVSFTQGDGDLRVEARLQSSAQRSGGSASFGPSPKGLKLDEAKNDSPNYILPKTADVRDNFFVAEELGQGQVRVSSTP